MKKSNQSAAECPIHMNTQSVVDTYIRGRRWFISVSISQRY